MTPSTSHSPLSTFHFPLSTSHFLLVLLTFVTAAGCRQKPASLNAARESAYRANNLGVALLEQFKYPDAAAAFRRALQIDGSLAVAHLNLSLALLYAQDLPGAQREAEEAARLQPDAAQPPYVLGLVARAENRLDQALTFFRRVQTIDPRDPGTNINLGQLLLQDRKLPDAMTVLRRAAADEPYNATAIYNLGLALTRDGRTEEGRKMLERSQALRATGYAVTFGTGYLEQGRYAEALASTGLEPELVDTRVPDISLTPTALATLPARASLPASSPFGRRFTADDLTEEGARSLAASMGGCLTLIDFDHDGDLDVFVARSDGQHLFRNGRGTWTDVTAASGLGDAPRGAVPVGCIAADFDNDGRPDLFVLRFGAGSLYRNEGNGHFADVTKTAGLPPYPFLPGAAALVDVDHDGDLDLIIAGLADVTATRERAAPGGALFPSEFVPAPVQLLRNNGNGTFTDITRIAGVDIRTHAIGVAPTDFDNRRDVDLLIVNRDSPPVLFKNLRDGTFRDVAAEVGLAAALASPATPNDEITAVAVADINKDDFPDFFFARPKGNVFALSNGRGGYALVPAPGVAGPAVASQFFDYDNDGLLDLLTWSADGPHLFRNLGNRWDDVTTRALAASRSASPLPFAPVSGHALAIADLDGDGQTDLVAGTPGGPTLWRNNAEGHGQSVRVRLTGTVSNRSAVGTKVQLRAGSLSARLETSAATPSIAPFDLVFGLGARGSADVVRVLWPSGILQAETLGPSETPGAQAGTRGSDRAALVAITELNRKPSSCPFLFTWNGARFEFVSDFMGGGELGYWEAPGERNRPDPIEYVRIRSDQLQPRNGRFEIRVANELEEALFLDRLQLLVIAHPRAIDVFPNEGMSDPPKPFRLYAAADERVPAHAWDAGGRDVTDRIARLDRLYPDDFPLAPFRGYAAPHALTLDLGLAARSVPTLLLLTGWTDYAFSSDNVAAHQAGLSLRPPSLQIRDRAGAWRDAIADIGIPVGRPQTIALDLAGRLRAGEHEVRIVTNMRIYWDQILVARPVPTDNLSVVRLDPLTATLRARGFSAEARPDGRDPVSYDYARVTPQSSWKVIPGRYTREGDVRELVTHADDMFVIAKPGDEIAVVFDAGTMAPLPEGWTRTFLLLADGFSKEMDINSATPDVLEPLPFHRMTRYPYGPPDAYPNGPKYRRYRERYNTRAVSRPLPPIVFSK